MPQKLVGASISLLIVSFLFCLFHLLPALSRLYGRDAFYLKNAAVLNCLANGFEETCPVRPIQYHHHTFDDEPRETKVPAHQRLWIPNAPNIKIFRSITLFSVHRVYPSDQGLSKQNQHQKQKQHSLPSSQISRSERSSKGSHTTLPRCDYVNNNDNDNNKKQSPQLRRQTPLHSPPDIKNIPQLIYASYQQQEPQEQLEQQLRQRPLYISTTSISSPIDLTNPNTTSSHPSSSYPLRATGSKISSREKEIRGSFLGMVVCIVVGVMWI
ncbi:hypothetical protein EMCG_08617 [[Emmonsia] crescens]|uniref:Uncharacterized protein n=1 Tax=[Emmonsia] crescens TaxID=73230 RepID=A0A0G2J446_9EURO|nr:hypothetical protein EMCG_08617 [Emmonsia crescens UAMH 3008]